MASPIFRVILSIWRLAITASSADDSNYYSWLTLFLNLAPLIRSRRVVRLIRNRVAIWQVDSAYGVPIVL